MTFELSQFHTYGVQRSDTIILIHNDVYKEGERRNKANCTVLSAVSDYSVYSGMVMYGFLVPLPRPHQVAYQSYHYPILVTNIYL